MPWKAQQCPFCDKKYANKKGLTKHLLKYTGSRRYPADGSHDVLEIERLSIMSFHFPEETRSSYRCPSCLAVINHRQVFLDHVIHRNHYEPLEKSISWNSQLPFDPEPYKIWQPKGPFPFLNLPPELREMIYRAVLCFERIEIRHIRRKTVDPVKGVYLQHNPPNNLLSLMAVNRQVYNEACRVFYRYNTFIFRCKEALPVFLVAIGKENALFLKSIKWKRDSNLRESHIEAIKAHITQNSVQSQQVQEIDIWNNEDQFVALSEVIMFPHPVYRGSTDRPLRLDADDVSPKDGYERYVLNVECYEDTGKKRSCEAGYEMRTRRVKDNDPKRIAALQALMDLHR